MKNKIVLNTLIVLLLVVVGIGCASYGYLRIKKGQTNSNVVSTLACLDISLEDEKNDINLQSAYAISDEEGKRLTPFTFTLTNNCDTPVKAVINLEKQSSSTINTNYIRYGFNEVGSTILPATLSSDNKELATEVRLEAGAPISYELRLWILESATFTEAGGNQKYEGKIVVTASPTE